MSTFKGLSDSALAFLHYGLPARIFRVLNSLEVRIKNIKILMLY